MYKRVPKSSKDKKERKRLKKYNKTSNHSDIASLFLDFALRITNSFLK